MGRQYNFIYRKLVTDSSDIEGHIAYALYKEDKEAYIEKFKKEHNDTAPTEEELKPFHDMSCLDSVLDKYKLTAKIILDNFLNDALNESIGEIENKCINDHKNMFAEVIEPLKPKSVERRFLEGTLQSMFGALAFAALLALIGFINLFKANDVNVNITAKTPIENNQIYQRDSIPIDNTLIRK